MTGAARVEETGIIPRAHLQIDPAKRIGEDPKFGHNRWHESIEPVLEVDDGDVVVMDTRDGFDGQITRALDASSFSSVSFLPNHPMTGPVSVRGAEVGDVLEVEVVDIEPDPFGGYGFTAIAPGFGLLRDDYRTPYIVHWDLVGREFAESPQLPGVRVPFAPFCGIMGVAPDAEFRHRVELREAALAATGQTVMLPDPRDAVPGHGAAATEGLRTIPPRENGGNLDAKQLGPGSRIYLPVYVPGGRFSVGDVHFAQGDGESCGSAIEMRARVTLRFRLHHAGDAARREIPPVFLTPPDPVSGPGRQIGFTGLCLEAGKNYSEDLTIAARGAVRSLICHLERCGYTPEQAYVIASVAADLRVSQVVDVPNVSVSALLDLSIFTDGGDRVVAGLTNAVR
jgi:formamidase